MTNLWTKQFEQNKMVSLKYFSPEEIKDNRERIRGHLGEKSSPVVESGQAEKIVLGYLKREDKILDCGPGTGHFLRGLYKNGFRDLYAVDIDDYLAFGEAKEFKTADLSFNKIPWEDGFLDAVTAWQTIEHLENPHNFIREAHRILKPGALFIFSMPNIQHIFNRIFFFRKGDMYRWRKGNNHLAVFPKGVFQKSFLKYFDLVEKKFTDGEFPYRFLSKFKFPSNEWFGRDVIYILKNKK